MAECGDSVVITLQPKRVGSDAGSSDSADLATWHAFVQASSSCPNPNSANQGSWNWLSAAQQAWQCAGVGCQCIHGNCAHTHGANPQPIITEATRQPLDAMQRGTKRSYDRCDMYTDAGTRGMLYQNCNAHSESLRQYDILSLDRIITCFASGWFSPTAYNLLCAAVNTYVPTGTYTVVSSLVSFEAGLCTSDTMGMSDSFNKLATVRHKHYAEFAQLSEDATTHCVCEYASSFCLKDWERGLPKRKQRSIISVNLHRTLGGKRRVRALVKLGWSTFENVRDESEMLTAFLLYIVEIEKLAEADA